MYYEACVTTSAGRHRAVFISDVHLGSPGCQSELLLAFLRDLECERLYLIGDIIDGWRLKRGWIWPQSHNDVVQKILSLARKGTQVIYVPGNHDDRVREFCGVHFGDIRVMREAVHEAADGRRYLITHGDLYDGISHRSWLTAVVGDWSYRALVRINSVVGHALRQRGRRYWSFAAQVKAKLPRAARYVRDFECNLAEVARQRGLDGVICGHIHHPNRRDIDGIFYINDGDWVESCSAAVEGADGAIGLVYWRGAASTATESRPAPMAPELSTTPAHA